MLSISVNLSGLERLRDRFPRALQSAHSADPTVQGGLPKAHAGHPVPIMGAPSSLPAARPSSSLPLPPSPPAPPARGPRAANRPPRQRAGARSFGAPSLVSAPPATSSPSSSASPTPPSLPLPLQSAAAADRVVRSLEALGS